jgi:hypothetical protein
VGLALKKNGWTYPRGLEGPAALFGKNAESLSFIEQNNILKNYATFRWLGSEVSSGIAGTNFLSSGFIIKQQFISRLILFFVRFLSVPL